jgi:glycosyltransferase involved in cell wall biosynthesis
LIVSHASSVDAAVAFVERHLSSPRACDLLVYGRSGADYPPPAGTRLINLPETDGKVLRRLVRIGAFVRALRARRYSLGVVAQPRLPLHHSRGLLLAFAAVAGARDIRGLDATTGDSERLTPRRALADGASWLVLRFAARVVMEAAAHAVRLIGARLRADAPLTALAEAGGTVLYLRTDLELVGLELDAGGSAAHTAGIVNALARGGWSVEARTTGHITGFAEQVRQARLPHWAPPNVPKELAELVSGILQARLRRPHDVRLIYQRYSLNNLAGALLARRWRLPLVLEANDSEVTWRQEAGSLTYRGLARSCEQAILGAADRVVAVSVNAAKELEQSGAPRERLRVIPNGVDVETFRGASPIALPFPSGCFVIGFVGLFYPWHGVRVLADAFVRLHRRHPEMRLVLVGDGEERPHVEDLLRRGDAIGSCLVTGAIPRAEVPLYLAAMDVAVACHADVPGFIGSPVKIFEYMAAGKAIVATRVGQIPEVLRDRDTALLVAPGQPEALCDAVETLFHDRPLRSRLAESAAIEAERKHTWDARVRSILA